MKMGRERAALRWEARMALLRRRLARVEEGLATLNGTESKDGKQRDRRAKLQREREELRAQIVALGPSPQAKMG